MMLQLFMMHKNYMIGIAMLFCSGNLVLILEYLMYKKLIKESDQIACTNQTTLLQFRELYEERKDINKGELNIEHFVDKYLKECKFCGISMKMIRHLSGQLILIGVLSSGIGACLCIIEKRTMLQLLPFYMACFAGVYLYFAISAFTDCEEQRMSLRMNLIDYLKQSSENKEIVWESGEQNHPNQSLTVNDLETSSKEKELFDLLDEIFLIE